MKDLVEALKDSRNHIHHMPRHLVVGFNSFLLEHGSDDLDEDICRFVDTTHYSPRTKNVYRNMLRRFLENLGEL